MCDTEEKKQDFIRNYAAQLSIQVSLRQNTLYKKDLKDHKIIRSFWKRKLKCISIDKNILSEEVYIKEILQLKSEMNKNFSDYFYKDGFKISHSQKSISVYLKHLWCHGFIGIPPQCPVDRKIINEIPRNISLNRCWTSINDIDEHMKIIGELRKIANNVPLAEWELCNFSFIDDDVD